MSIVTTVYVPEGIVMAGDSRLTRTVEEEENGEKIKIKYTSTDNSQKVFLLSKISVGVIFCGNATINGNTIADYIRLFEIECLDEADTVITVAQKLYNRTKNSGIHFIVCGYLNDIPYVYDVAEKCIRENINKNEEVVYSATWCGKTDAITRLLNSEPRTIVKWASMPLKDAVEFAEYIVDTTINYEKFSDIIQTCGGPVDILIINKDDAFWYRHKIYKP